MIKSKKNGWVYFIRSGTKYKVGACSGSIRDRMKNYRTHNPAIIHILHLVYVGDSRHLEESCHSLMKKKGEYDWVAMNKEKVEQIKRVMTLYQEENFVIPNYTKQIVGIFI